MKGRRLVRIALGLTVAGGAAFSSSVLPSKAISPTPITYTKGCGFNLDPVKTQNALTATPDPSRKWDDIQSITAQTGPTSPDGQTAQVEFDLTLCGNLPAFPDAATPPDGGAEFIVCLDPDGSESIATGPTVIGVGHRGGPTLDGPYPTTQGWKGCAWVNLQADASGNLNSWGVATWDPIGQYTFFDNSQLVDNNSVATVSPAVAVTGTNVVKVFFPYQWIVHVNPNALGGPAKETSETWIKAGDHVSNVVATSQVASTGTLPFPVCLGTSGIACDGSELVGPIFGVGGLLTQTDSIPGTQSCTTPITGCTNSGEGYDLGLLPIGFPAQSQPTCVSTRAPIGQATCQVSAGFYNYYPCLPTDSWGSIPGLIPSFNQNELPTSAAAAKPAPPPYYQDAGDAKASGCAATTAVPLDYEYDVQYGRNPDPQVPSTVPVVGGYHLLPTYEPAPELNFTG